MALHGSQKNDPHHSQLKGSRTCHVIETFLQPLWVGVLLLLRLCFTRLLFCHIYIKITFCLLLGRLTEDWLTDLSLMWCRGPNYKRIVHLLLLFGGLEDVLYNPYLAYLKWKS